MKEIIGASAQQTDLFLTLIDEEGLIFCANANMLKNLELQNPRLQATNFFDLVHPVQVDEFKKVIYKAAEAASSLGIEVYIKNGYYHPMKWQVSYLKGDQDAKNTYLCLGYKLMDDERTDKFNRLLKNNSSFIIEGLSGIIFHDADGELIATNHKTASIFDTTLESLYQIKDIATLWDTAWHINDEYGRRIPFEDAPFVKALRSRHVEQHTLEVRLRSGEKRWIRFSSQALPEAATDGQFAVVTSLIDVTNERQLSIQLQDREILIDSFMKQTPGLAWIVDEEERLLFASNAFYKIYGHSEEEFKSKKITELLPEAVVKAVYDKHIQVLETLEPAETTQHIKWADGSQFISYINIFPIHSQSGKMMLGGQAINLPDKSQLEKELKQAHERLLNLSRATSNAIWEWDMQTGQIFRNEALMEMIGYQPDNSKGLSWWLRRIHPEDRNRVSKKVKEATDNLKQSWQDEYRFKCADGSYKPVQDKGFVVYENGLPVKMIGSLQDISNLKDLENELADERLQNQKDIAETVIRVQEKERTRIGHELHDNVNQIISTAKLFVDMFEPDRKEQAQMKAKSMDYLQMAIEEIRKLTKELVAPQMKELSLTDNINALIDDMHLARAIRINFSHDDECDEISSGKRITLFRIVQEQLKNILKHSKATCTHISLYVIDNDIHLEIEDNGKGFNPRQTHQGIGLSNIHERTQFYNGTVEINAAPGEGCKLTVTIPAFD
jgi:PAS domain S-box-containing protein